MSFLDDAVSTLTDVFLGGPDSWNKRLEQDFILTSPEGTEYKPFYTGKDPFKIRKRLGIFNYPLVDGSVVQDFGTDSMTTPSNLVFIGKNNDVNARAFFKSCKERGLWSITHPVHGEYDLQLVSASMNNENEGYTTIDVEWIEPIDPILLKTSRELAGLVDQQISNLNTGALDQFVNDINQATSTYKNIVKTTTEGIGNVVDYALYPLFGIVDAINSIINTTHNGITDLLNETILPLEMLAGQIQDLISYPALVSTDLDTRLDAYSNLKTGLFNLLPNESTTPLQKTSSIQAQINNIATTELALTSCIASFSRIAITCNLETREQAIDLAENISEVFESIKETLEEKQSVYDTQYIDIQYFSQSNTYNDIAKLVYLTVQYLLRKSFDLKIRKTIKLTKPTMPIILAGQYYDDFEQLEYLIETNKLHGSEIIILLAGREVDFYV